MRKMIHPGPKNSGPKPSSFRFLIGGTLGPRQAGPLLDEILATCLAFKLSKRVLSQPVLFARVVESAGRVCIIL